MSTLILSSAEATWTVPSAATVNIFGSSSTDTVQVEAGASVTFNSFNSGDILSILGNASDYSVRHSGATVFLQHSSGDEIQLAAGLESVHVNFNDKQLELIIDTSTGSVKLGDQTLSTTNSAIVMPTDIGSSVTLTPDTSGHITANSGVGEVVSFSSSNLTSGQYTVFGFSTGEDTLKLSGLTGASGSKLSELNGDTISTGQIGVQIDQIQGDTFINLGNDNNGDVISIRLNGVTEPALVDVTFA